MDEGMSSEQTIVAALKRFLASFHEALRIEDAYAQGALNGQNFVERVSDSFLNKALAYVVFQQARSFSGGNRRSAFGYRWRVRCCCLLLALSQRWEAAG